MAITSSQKECFIRHLGPLAIHYGRSSVSLGVYDALGMIICLIGGKEKSL